MAAADDLEGICNYLYLYHPSSAVETIRRLDDAAKSLKAFPHSGRVGAKSGTRELILAPLPYILVYSLDDGSVHILRFLHTSQDRK